MRTFLRSGLAMVVTIALFILLIEWLIGWNVVASAWLSLSLAQQVIAVVLLTLTYLVRAWRNFDYFGDKLRGRWLQCLYVTLIHNALNNVLPLRSGEVSFPLLMRRRLGLGYSRTVPALLLMRVMDFAVLAIMALALSPWLNNQWWLIALALPLPLLGYPAQRYLLKPLLPRRHHKLFRLLVKAMAGLPRTLSAYTRCYLLSWVNWVTKLGMLSWLLASMTDSSITQSFFGAIGGELTSILPVNPPAGLGSYEAGIVAGMAYWHGPAAEVLGAAVNVHLLLLLSSLVAAGLALLITAPTDHER